MLDCPLKRESSSVIAELLHSSHRVIMITGDSALTALSVARKVRVRVGRTCSSWRPAHPETAQLKMAQHECDSVAILEAISGGGGGGGGGASSDGEVMVQWTLVGRRGAPDSFRDFEGPTDGVLTEETRQLCVTGGAIEALSRGGAHTRRSLVALALHVRVCVRSGAPCSRCS